MISLGVVFEYLQKGSHFYLFESWLLQVTKCWMAFCVSNKARLLIPVDGNVRMEAREGQGQVRVKCWEMWE